MAALMAYQWLEQKMLLPDLVIPLPVSFGSRYRHGFDGNFLLASEVARLFSVPVVRTLNSRFDTTHFLTQGEFRSQFCLKSRIKEPLADRTLLLIAPLLEDARLRNAGELLQAHFPAQMCALAFTAY
jgi:predicted amidophosphoribosyltransferase